MFLRGQTARAAIANVDPLLENAAHTLGSSEMAIFWRVTLPLARRGIMAGLVLGAARALGERLPPWVVNPHSPGRVERRSVTRRPTPYPLLTTPRREAHKALVHQPVGA